MDGDPRWVGLHHRRVQLPGARHGGLRSCLVHLSDNVGLGSPPAALTLIHDLLLVVILLELFRTIINFLKTHVITLEPFLYICIIASTRRILTTGAETAYSENLTTEVFHRYLLDVGVNVLVIVALVLAVFLARKGGQQSASLR